MNPVQIFYKYTAWKNAKQYTKKKKEKKEKVFKCETTNPKLILGL